MTEEPEVAAEIEQPSQATDPTTHAPVEPPAAGRRSHIVRRFTATVLLLLTTAASLLVGTTSASADVVTGGGARASTVIRCTPGPNSTTLQVEAHLGQEAVGQSVGVYVYALDSRGWEPGLWKTATSPATWSYDNSVHLTTTFYGLTGRVATVYVYYYWYRTSGWVSTGEYVATGC